MAQEGRLRSLQLCAQWRRGAGVTLMLVQLNCVSGEEVQHLCSEMSVFLTCRSELLNAD